MRFRLWGLQLVPQEITGIARSVGVVRRTVERWVTPRGGETRRPNEDQAERIGRYLNRAAQFDWDAGPIAFLEEARPVVFVTSRREVALMVCAGAVIAAEEGPGGNFPDRYEAFTQAYKVRMTYVPPGRANIERGEWQVYVRRWKKDESPKDYKHADRRKSHVNMREYRRRANQVIEEYSRPAAAEFWKSSKFKAE